LISGSARRAPGTGQTRATRRGQRHRPERASRRPLALHRQPAQPGGGGGGGASPEQPAQRPLGGSSQADGFSPRRAAAWRSTSAASLDRPLGGGAPTSRLQPAPVASGQNAASLRTGPLFQVGHHRGGPPPPSGRAPSTTEAPVSSAMKGQQVVADAIAEEPDSSRLLGFLRPGETSSAQVLLDRGPPRLDQRADQGARAPARLPPQPARTRALQETHQDRLGLVVRGMARWRCAPAPDQRGATPLERGVAGPPALRLEARPRAAPGAP